MPSRDCCSMFPWRRKLSWAQRRRDSVDMDVAVDASVEPGVYNLRLSTADGVTAPEVITIDRLPQRAAATPNQVETLPVSLHGAVIGAAVQESKFTGRAGEKITIDVLAARFGAKLRPVLHLYDAQRRQIAWSLPQTALAGDARLAAELRADGVYTVAVHDLAYAGAAPGYYRLAIGPLDYADQVFPAVVSRNGRPALALIGKFGGQTAARLEANQAAPSSETALADAAGSWQPVAWPTGSSPVGLRPQVQLSDLPELIEGQTLDASRTLQGVPTAVNGLLSDAGEEDVYYLDVAEGDKLRIEVFAERLRSAIDARLELRDAKGTRLMAIDDVAPGIDPRLDYVVPKDLPRLAITVADARRAGGANCVYRLLVSRPEATAAPDFALRVLEDTYHVLPSSTTVLRVFADRTNYDGPIQLSIEGLPAGMTAAPIEIPARALGALMEIRRDVAAASAGQGLSSRILIRGRAAASASAADASAATPSAKTQEMVRVAAVSSHPLAALQPWLRYNVAVAGTDAPVPFGVAWDTANTETQPYIGIDGKLRVRLARGPGANGIVRLSIVTSQPPALVNGNLNAAAMLRGTTPTTDIAINEPVRLASVAVTQAEKGLDDLKKKLPRKASRTRPWPHSSPPPRRTETKPCRNSAKPKASCQRITSTPWSCPPS